MKLRLTVMNKKGIILIVVASVAIIIVIIYFALKKVNASTLMIGEADSRGSSESTNTTADFPMKMGSRGNEVTFLQAYINQYFGGQLATDGIWGAKTQTAFENFVSKVEFISSGQYITEAEYKGFIQPHESHLLA